MAHPLSLVLQALQLTKGGSAKKQTEVLASLGCLYIPNQEENMDAWAHRQDTY